MTHVSTRDPRVCWIHYVSVTLMNQCSRLGCERQIGKDNRALALCHACYESRRAKEARALRDQGPKLGEPPEPVLNRPWQEQAACRGMDPELFYPGPGEAQKVRVARAVCRSCPVQERCREFALSLRDPFGIFGGTTPKERLRLRGELVGA